MKSEAGNVVFYIFAAFGLLAFLVFMMTKGTDESINATEAQKQALLVKSDISTIHNAVQRCALMYQKPVDLDGDGDADVMDNPSPPFPLYNKSGLGYGNSYGNVGVDIKTVICPGAPVGEDKILDGDAGEFLSTLSRANYTVTYTTDIVLGVGIISITIDNSEKSPAWTEAMTRIDNQLDPNNAGIVDIDVATGTCATGGGCLIYWIKKL